MNTHLFILGSHPLISQLELQRAPTMDHRAISTNPGSPRIAWVEGALHVTPHELMNRLGGTVKIATLIGPYTPDAVAEWLPTCISQQKKFSFGFSLLIHAAGRRHREFDDLGIALKKMLKTHGHSARYVSSREPELSSVIVDKEGLLTHGADIVIVERGNELFFGRTLAVQPFEEFSHRDYGRPQRDHRSGMLPPKLARMMVNITAPQSKDVILDPFCGSGTVLQEALLLGYHSVIGSDISQQCIDDTRKNLQWMKLPSATLYCHDVTHITDVLKRQSVDCVVGEGYLGPTRPARPEVVRDKLTSMYQKTFAALVPILRPKARVVIALPAWRPQQQQSKSGKDIITIKMSKTLQSLGYRSFHQPLFYGRPDAHVLRHLYFLER